MLPLSRNLSNRLGIAQRRLFRKKRHEEPQRNGEGQCNDNHGERVRPRAADDPVDEEYTQVESEQGEEQSYGNLDQVAEGLMPDPKRREENPQNDRSNRAGIVPREPCLLSYRHRPDWEAQEKAEKSKNEKS